MKARWTDDPRQGHRTSYPVAFPVKLSRDGEPVEVAVRQSVRAADLLALERCSAACLLAQEEGDCACRCEREFHGVLVDSEVTVDGPAWTAFAQVRAPRTDPLAYEAVTRLQLQQLPLKAPACALRLQVAMLAWNCGARAAAKRLGISDSTMRRALRGGSR